MAKRGYSRAFTPRTDRRMRYLLDDVPPSLWEDARAKAKRSGLSMRGLLLTLLKAWTDGVVALPPPIPLGARSRGAGRAGDRPAPPA